MKDPYNFAKKRSENTLRHHTLKSHFEITLLLVVDP